MVKLARRNRRDLMSLIVGLFFGILLGVAMMATSPDLRDTFVGTAADVGSDDESVGSGGAEFYLADLESTREWLIAHSPDEEEQITSALEILVSLPESPAFRQDFQAAHDDLDLVLPQLYRELGKPLGVESSTSVASHNVLSACLGMDDDPYSATPNLYFYLTIPKQESSNLVLPAQWKKLDEPRSNTLFWQLLGCYPQPES